MRNLLGVKSQSHFNVISMQKIDFSMQRFDFGDLSFFQDHDDSDADFDPDDFKTIFNFRSFL